MGLLSKVEEPVKFFLRCDPEAKFFYAVEFHATQPQLLRAMSALTGTPVEKMTMLEREARAACVRYKYRHAPGCCPRALAKKHKLIGTLFFVQGDAEYSTVIHELTHAAIGWAKAAGIDPRKQSKRYDACPEEKFARTLEFLVTQFYSHAPAAIEKSLQA